MTDIDRIRDQIERAFDGDPWCGPSLMSVLEGITSDQAVRRVLGISHSIWEIVLHVSAWQGTVARRIAGEPVATPEEGDWLPIHDTGDVGWQAAIAGARRFAPATTQCSSTRSMGRSWMTKSETAVTRRWGAG